LTVRINPDRHPFKVERGDELGSEGDAHGAEVYLKFDGLWLRHGSPWSHLDPLRRTRIHPDKIPTKGYKTG
jgi:hypothetical protein